MSDGQAASIALYNDYAQTQGAGAWADGVTAIKAMLTNLGHSYEEIDYRVLNDPSQDLSSRYDVILIPGGYAAYYDLWISTLGKQRIRDFVSNGGGYFGICAGAFFAADTTVWEGVSYDDSYLGHYWNVYSKQSEPFYGYSLDLFSGTATGPISEIGDLSHKTMTTFRFDSANDVLSGYKDVPYTEDILYYGGPYFAVSDGWWGDTEILATYASSAEAGGKPAIIGFEYGNGRVVLSAPHPEIEEDSDRDGVTLDDEWALSDNGSDWDLVGHLIDWLTVERSASCPSLYYWDGASYAKRSFIFPGAMPRDNEQRDYIPLNEGHLVLKDGRYQLQIRETEPEWSYLDFAELVIIDHDPEADVFDYVQIRNTESAPKDPAARAAHNEISALPDLASLGTVARVVALSAEHSRYGDVRQLLARSDDHYAEMSTGDTVTLTFPYRPKTHEDQVRDFLFIGEGYYLPFVEVGPNEVR